MSGCSRQAVPIGTALLQRMAYGKDPGTHVEIVYAIGVVMDHSMNHHHPMSQQRF